MPKYKVGDVVRYASGITALMRVDSIREFRTFGPRYYGTQFFGGAVGAYEFDCTRPTKEDLALWATRDSCNECGKKLDNGPGCERCVSCSRKAWFTQVSLG